MRVDWTPRSLADLDRVEAFLQPKSMAAAVALKKRILTALDLLTLTPRMGAPITHSAGVEIRRIIIDEYEIWRDNLEENGAAIRMRSGSRSR